MTWQASGGAVEHTVAFGGTPAALRDYVGAAERVGDGQVRFTIVRNGRLALTVSVIVRDGRMQTRHSIGADGHVYYDGGIELQTGRPGLSDERCAPVMS